MELTLSVFQSFGLTDIMLWLLTFAIVYGVLSKSKVIESNTARAIIGIVLGFLVLLTPFHVLVSEILTKIASDLVLIVIGILLILVFLEVIGAKTKGKLKGYHPETKEPVYEYEKPIHYFQYHSGLTAIIFIAIAVFVFIHAGGLELLGIDIAQINKSGLFFIIVVILGVMWLISRKPEEEKR